MIFERTVADFFAGIGLVTLGFQRQGWETVYAVDYSPEKKEIYQANFNSKHYQLEDVKNIKGNDIPKVTLAHASFPCTDLSIAGSRLGIQSGESSAFWEFARILEEMQESASTELPPLVQIENVEGLLTSNEGKDLAAILDFLNTLNYSVDMLLVDAANFVPQSRSRLFIIGAHKSFFSNSNQSSDLSNISDARPQKVLDYIRDHPQFEWRLQEIPNLPNRSSSLSDIVEVTSEWWVRERSDYLFSQMFERHKNIVRQMMANEYWSYGTVFRRMRKRNGKKQSTAELRYDGIAGCLRTPKGGSAKQILIRAGFGRYDARLINAQESAKLMGAEDLVLPENVSLNNALFGFGDAVCVPVVEWLVVNYFEPVLKQLEKDFEPEKLLI